LPSRVVKCGVVGLDVLTVPWTVLLVLLRG
jgi:hypothetical protein